MGHRRSGPKNASSAIAGVSILVVLGILFNAAESCGILKPDTKVYDSRCPPGRHWGGDDKTGRCMGF
jgi:hypothetical protein